MVTYDLVGQHVSFDDSALRFFDLQDFFRKAKANADKSLDQWYKNCKNIEYVLDNYSDFAIDTVESLVIHPLFQQLREIGIYDLSEQLYERQCLDLSACAQALDQIESQYQSILQEQQQKYDYRKARKAGRERLHVFAYTGMGDTIKRAAGTATLNTISGLGHSVFNAAGNAGSAIVASVSKSSLYSSPTTQSLLCSALDDAILLVVGAHIHVLNGYVPNYIHSTFDVDKSQALFENAKQIPEKRTELLIQAFSYCPWYEDLLIYIFTHYPNERSTIWSASQRFCIDLSVHVEDILAQQYPEAARHSEQAAQEAKKKILVLMKEFGISESATLNQLEQDCISRICQHFEIADEVTCNDMRSRIQSYDALPQNKDPFLKKIQQRIEIIWSEEDSKQFEQIYLQTDLVSPDSVAKAISFIQKEGRTSASEKYLAALHACTKENIEKARVYHQGNRPKLYKGLVIGTILLAILSFFTLGWPVSIVFGVAMIVFAGLWGGLKSNWDTLTIENTVIHPLLTVAPTQKEKVSAHQNNSQEASKAHSQVNFSKDTKPKKSEQENIEQDESQIEQPVTHVCRERATSSASSQMRVILQKVIRLLRWGIGILIILLGLLFWNDSLVTTVLWIVTGLLMLPLVANLLPIFPGRKFILPVICICLFFAGGMSLPPVENSNSSSDISVEGTTDSSQGALPDLSVNDTVSDASTSILAPAGTYQVMIGRSGILASISLLQDNTGTWCCDVIQWSPYERDSDIIEFYGPAEVAEDLRTITCGEFTFMLDENGSPYFDDALTDLSYTISAYTEGNTPESELNALIDLADNTTSLSIPQSTINHYIEQHSLEISLIHPLAAYTSSDLRVQYSVFNPSYYDYDVYGATNELNPLNPDHVYNVIEDGSKTDEELSDREFEQKYGYFFGYCYDFGKSHATSSDPT